MKFLTLIVSVGIVSVLFFLFCVGITGKIYEKNEIEFSLLDSVETISELKVGRIEDFILEIEKDLLYLSQKEEVLEIFRSNLTIEIDLLQKKIKNIAKNTANEIENYILENPEMALEDLKNSEEFNAIAVQGVGETGYTAVHDSKAINQFHVNPELVGFDLHNFAKNYSDFWSILDKSLVGESFGFYDWKDADESIKSKYMYCVPINKTELIVCATTYLDELNTVIQFAGYVNEELLLFQNLHNYVDMNLIDSSGNIIWTVEQKNDLGTNILTGRYNDTIFSDLYLNVIKNLNFEISDPTYYDLEKKTVIFVGSPIIEKSGELLGVFLLQFDLNLIEEFLSDILFVSEIGEQFIIDFSGKPITSLKYGSKNLNQIYGDKLTACFSEVGKGSGSYNNYQDISVVGAYERISGTNWCFFVEINEEYFLKEYFGIWNFGGERVIYFGIFLIIIFIILGLIFDKYFCLRRIKK